MTTIYNLDQEMVRYIEDIKYIWDTKIKCFLLSSDCVTLQYMSEQEYNKFFKFMLNQRTYKIATSTHQSSTIQRP